MSYVKYKRKPNLLRKYRREAGFKQAEVAKLLGLRNTAQISLWENSSRGMRVENAMLLSCLYGKMTDDIFQDTRKWAMESITRKKAELSQLSR